MGSFAVKNVPTMSLEEMKAYERILSCETVDLFNYLSGQTPVPEVGAARGCSRRVWRQPWTHLCLHAHTYWGVREVCA